MNDWEKNQIKKIRLAMDNGNTKLYQDQLLCKIIRSIYDEGVAEGNPPEVERHERIPMEDLD